MGVLNNMMLLLRRWMIYMCTQLTYLDGRPIQLRDRACIQAWKEVGISLLTDHEIFVVLGRVGG